MIDAVASTCTGECLKSGPWGLAIILILCIACYFLFKSMSKHLRKVRENFPVTDEQPADTEPEGEADSEPTVEPAEPDQPSA